MAKTKQKPLWALLAEPAPVAPSAVGVGSKRATKMRNLEGRYFIPIKGHFMDVLQFPASKGNATHTVSTDGVGLRCTCQGFRIRKLGYCKHTKLAEKALFGP